MRLETEEGSSGGRRGEREIAGSAKRPTVLSHPPERETDRQTDRQRERERERERERDRERERERERERL